MSHFSIESMISCANLSGHDKTLKNIITAMQIFLPYFDEDIIVNQLSAAILTPPVNVGCISTTRGEDLGQCNKL